MQEAVDLAQRVRAAGIHALLVRRASRHGQHRQLGPEILIEHIASATSRIRVGSGGIMLPNHTPLRVAEAFHTLEALHPGRIDLGIGRAPGTDPATSRALRPFDASQFPDQVREMLALSDRTLAARAPVCHRARRAVGRPAAADLGARVERRDGGLCRCARPRLRLRAPLQPHAAGPGGARVSPGVPALGAVRPAARDHRRVGHLRPTDDEAELQAASTDLAWVRLHRREFLPFPSPEEARAYKYSPQERVVVEMNRQRHFIGTPPKVVSLIRQIVEATEADEIMVTSMIYGRAERRRSYRAAGGRMGAAVAAAVRWPRAA